MHAPAPLEVGYETVDGRRPKRVTADEEGVEGEHRAQLRRPDEGRHQSVDAAPALQAHEVRRDAQHVGEGGEGLVPEFLEADAADFARLDHEAVLLGLGQRISSLLFDWVLSGQHKERIGNLVTHATNGDLPLLHRFEQCCLRFGGRAVDFVGENHMRENRTSQEADFALAGRFVLFNDVGTGDVGRH